MDPISIQNHFRSMQGIGSLSGPQEIRLAPSADLGADKVEGKSFGEILADSVKQVNEVQLQTDQAIQSLASGNGGNVHDTMLAVQKAELSMKMLLEVRNKMVSAYQEVMRMQV